ncbi:MAG: tail fiber domain-containing protein [Bacteroidota bacterium]
MNKFNWHIRPPVHFMVIICLGLWMSSVWPTFCQVGVGTTTPQATVDIRSSNQTSPGNTDGILIPKVDQFSGVNPSASQDGMLVFATGNGTPNKGFYYWDHTNTIWVPLTHTGGGGGNTLDQAYDQGGSGLGKNINASDGALRINGTDGFLVTGSLFTGNAIDTEVTGLGTRMFFNPYKSAFRAGSVLDLSPFLPSDQWDDANIGFYSTALGASTLASGDTSTAFGSITTASGNIATAFGSATTASGNTATAFGYNTLASGDHSVAFGYETTASATNSTAFGSFSTASGAFATAFGNVVSAPSFAETAVGTFNTLYTPNSAGGFNNADRLFVVGNGISLGARSDALTIYKSGVVYITNMAGIGTDTPTANLSVNGTANKPGGGAWAVFSDRRLKKNVSNYTEGLDLILNVNPVNFSYNDNMPALLGENETLAERVYQGVIAQELQTIAPNMVRNVAIGAEVYLEVDPNKFTYALINAVKQQHEMISKQNERLSDLENKLHEMRALLQKSKE